MRKHLPAAKCLPKLCLPGFRSIGSKVALVSILIWGGLFPSPAISQPSFQGGVLTLPVLVRRQTILDKVSSDLRGTLAHPGE
jgi:hypothetical protein